MSKHRKITPDLVEKNWVGQCTSHYFVRLPEWVVADDLKDPAIWSLVQSSRNPLRVHDAMYMVGFASSFAVEARVVQATNAAAVLALQKIISFPDRLTPLFSDDNYRVAWAVNGFAVERKADGVQVGGPFGSESLAVLHIKQNYAVRQ